MELLETGTSKSIWVHKVGRHGFGVVVMHIDGLEVKAGERPEKPLSPFKGPKSAI